VVPAVLAIGAMALAFAQRPGEMVIDTKVDLHLDPGGFLREVFSTWTPSADLGHIFSGQYGGYLFPMGPWFAAGHALGLPDWLVHRLWLGTLFALSAWGVVRLFDALLGRPRGAAHAAAGLLYVVNLYVTVYSNRTSISLLGHAALPWMLLCCHRGLRQPRSWAWPAAFALLLTSTGGAVNAAVTGWVCVGPLLLIAYERFFGGVGRGALRPFLLRMAVTNAVASAWWVVPLLMHSRYGLNFLEFTEQPGTIWSTTSLTESMRLMGFWTSYIGQGFGGSLIPYASQGNAILFDPWVVVSSLLIPGAALAGFLWTRHWRYGPFFALLTIVGLMVMVAGWPEGTPLRKGVTFTYNRLEAIQFLRTTYKAGSLVALGMAGLGGAAFGSLWLRLRDPRLRGAAAAVGLGVVLVASWPLTSGRALERALTIPHGVPPAWHAVAKDLDDSPDHDRALSMPGQLFGHYDWGGTIDHVLTGLTRHPVITRYIVPYADLRAVDAQWAVEDLVDHELAVPGQLPPLLDLLAVGDIVLGADGNRGQSGEVSPAIAADLLADQGIIRPARGGRRCTNEPGEACAFDGRILPGRHATGVTTYGATLSVQRDPGRIAGPVRLPRVTRVKVKTRGYVRLLARDAPPTIVDGAAQGIIALAAYGALPADRPVSYAADEGPAAIRAAAQRGADLVISDSNRRQAFVPARLRGNRGPILTVRQGVSEDGVILDPFPAQGTAGQTVAVQQGVRLVTAPASPQSTQSPERRPYAAIDGDLDTKWIADRYLARDRHVLTVELGAPRDVPHVDLYPYSDSRGVVTAVTVNGVRFVVHRGWNRLTLGLRGVSRLDVAIADVRRPVHANASAAGIRELRIPGVRVTERIRSPLLIATAVAGADLRRSSLTYLFDRVTGHAPSWRSPASGEAGLALLRDEGDAEPSLARLVRVPVARRFEAEAWVRPDRAAPDGDFDRLVGAAGASVDSSGRFEGAPRYRGSSALDGDARTAWVAPWVTGHRTWLAWRTAVPHTIRRLRLVPAAVRVRRPVTVRVTVDGRAGRPLPVAADGTVTVPPVRGRSVRVDVLAARFPAGTPGRFRQRRAVGVAEVRGAGARVALRRSGPLRAGCVVELTVGGEPVRLRPAGTVADLEAGAPLRARGCAPVEVAAGEQELLAVRGTFAVDHLRLRSPADTGSLAGSAARGARAGQVLDDGDMGEGARTGTQVRIDRPAWIVLAESFSPAWRASCDGHGLGAPVPLQGYANGWPVERGCRTVDFWFQPNRTVLPFYALSLAGCLTFLGGLLLWVRRRRRAGASSAPAPADIPPGTPLRLPLGRALALAFALCLVVGFCFGLRAGAVSGPTLLWILWRGTPSRTLMAVVAVALMLVVPILYLAHSGANLGGYNTHYAMSHLVAHWVAVGALVLVAVVLVRALSRARGLRDDARAGASPESAAPAAGP
jgi:arabinofuranan 3-O-arabinosyltransferase